MGKQRFVLGSAIASLAIVASFFAGAIGGSASPPAPLVIGVDNEGPSGHNFQYLDFYPRQGTLIHNGSVIGFNFNTKSLDGFHTATLGKQGESASDIVANHPLFVPDADTGDAAGQLQLPLSIFFPSQPPASAPSGCGTADKPCPFHGTNEINSGALCNAVCPNTQFFYRIALEESPSEPVTFNFVCLIHGPIMSGSFTVVPDEATASKQSSLDTLAATQFGPQTAAGLAAFTSANNSAVTDSNGVRTFTLKAGTESADGHVQVLEMLPRSVSLKAGDRIKWTSPSKNEVHTVTFPQGHGSDSVDPLPLVCEGANGDTRPNFSAGPPFFGCGAPGTATALENHLNPQPQGGTVIDSLSRVATSGVVSSIPGIPFPQTTASFSFPTAGLTFTYQCRIHDHMAGTVVTAPAVVLAQTGSSTRQPGAPIATVVLLLLGLLALGSGVLLRRRTS